MKFFPLVVLIILILFKSNIDAYSQNVRPITFKEALNGFYHLRDWSQDVDASEIYFTAQSPSKDISVIFTMKKKGKKYLDPVPASFSGEFMDLEPFLSPDGLRLYFASKRIDPKDSTTLSFDIFYVERVSKDAEWSAPIRLSNEINTEVDEFFPSVSKYGTLFFCRMSNSTTKEDIYSAKKNSIGFDSAQLVVGKLNSNAFEFNAYVSESEDFILLTLYGKEGDAGGGDLYVSYRLEDGSYDVPEWLGDAVNSKSLDYCPFYDSKRKVLIFSSQRSLLPTNKTKIRTKESFLSVIRQYENGLGRLYEVPWMPRER